MNLLNKILPLLIVLAAGPALRASAQAPDRHKPVAAVVNEKNLYWQKNRGRSFPLDTCGLESVEKKMCDTARSGETQIDAAAAFLAPHGKVLYRMESPQSIALALMVKCGYPVILFSQMAGDIAIATAVTAPQRAPAPGQPDANQTTPADLFGLQENDLTDTSGQINYRKMRICSDFWWDLIDTCAIFPPAGTRTGFNVQLGVAGGGYCEFEGAENISLNSKPIRQIEGFAVRNHWLTYQSDGQVNRLFLSVFLCADRDKSPAAIRRQVEQKMDSLKLDLSYKFPRLVPVAPHKPAI
jgi:hypothetical protein